MKPSTVSRRDLFRLGALGFAASMTGRAAQTLLRRPYVQNIQDRRATVLWATLDSGEGSVLVSGPEGAAYPVAATRRTMAPAVTRLPQPFYLHQAHVTGLTPSTSYHYQIAMSGQALTAAPATFKTSGPGNFSFLVFGDSGEKTAGQIGLVDQMRRERGVSFTVHTGDLAYPEGDFERYESNYFGINAPLMESLPFYATPGNHDYMVDQGHPFVASHSVPDSNVPLEDEGRYYSFDWGEAHFTSIDSNLILSDRATAMTDWLSRDLQASRKFWKVLMLHHTPYPTGQHLNDPHCAQVRERITPIAERYGVQLVLGGHEHGYERTVGMLEGRPAAAGHGTTYITSGGGGAYLHNVAVTSQTAVALSTFNYGRIDVDDGSLRLRAVGVDGKELDRVVLEPRPVVFAGGVVRASDYSPKLTAGQPAAIFGQNLGLRSALRMQGAMELSGTRVRLGEWDVPVIYSSPGQVNVQIPPGVSGVMPLRVFTANGSAAVEVIVS